jgi:hypothetical protein
MPTPRHSSGLEQFSLILGQGPGLSVLDLGPTSPSNIDYIIGLGHRATSESLAVAAADASYLLPAGEGGEKVFDADAFLKANLIYPESSFDAVLLWDLCDYLPEPLVRPVVERLTRCCRPGASLLGFFHTREAGAEAPFHRYRIAAQDTVELQPCEGPRLARTFANRHIEKLFPNCRSIKFFLGKDNMREVLILL